MSKTTDPELYKSTNSELNPRMMYAQVDEKKYKPELEIFDRWQSFSAEMLRLGILGIAVFGFLYQQVFAGFNLLVNPDIPIRLIKVLSQLSLALFAFATVCALLYRYGSTEAMMHYVRGLRSDQEAISTQELKYRNWWLSKCLIFKIISAACLGLGALLSAIAFFKLL